MKRFVISALLSLSSLSAFAGAPQIEGHTKDLKVFTFGDDIALISSYYSVRCTHYRTDRDIDKYTQHKMLTYVFHACASPQEPSLDSTKAMVTIFRDLDENSWSMAIGSIPRLNAPFFSNLSIDKDGG